MLTRLKLSTKILLVGVVLAVGAPIPLLTVLLPRERASAYDMKSEGTRYVVDMAWGVLDYYAHQAKAGRITIAEAQALAKNTLRGERFQNGNYVWINDSHPVMIMHPMNPALEGKDLSGVRDPKGVALFVEMARVCSAQGSGSVRYMWPKPGNTEPSPKVSYVRLYPDWGWIVGAGIYTDDVEAAVQKTRVFIYVFSATGLLAALLLSYVMARSLAGPLRRATASLTQVTQQSLLAVEHVSRASQSMASGTSEQAASLEETSAALNELTDHARQSFAAAQDIQALVGRVKSVVDQGNAHMEEMNGAIRQIGGAAQKVRSIVKTIEEIAFQTNILALNAAVEAARAGEAGAGFSVVADEVRNLAQRASQAAKQTADLIGASLESSEQGANISSRLTQAFSDIVSQIQEVSAGLGRITASSQGETDGITQINTAVSEISSVTQAQASTSEQTASAAEELRAQSSSLQDLAGELQALVEGSPTRAS